MANWAPAEIPQYKYKTISLDIHSFLHHTVFQAWY